MDNSKLFRIGKIAAGGLVTVFLLMGTFSGKINIAPWHLFERGQHPFAIGIIYAVVFFFPYLLMSSIIQPGEAVLGADGDEGVMGSYGTQNAVSQRYRRQMIAVVFGIVITAICIFASNAFGPRMY